ncbi:MAG TPA: HK97-gp10 family putative phage morphogenesis protein [Tepidisphaeraceae bacterium]|jgi:HK97 gp10 family phage protein
MSDDGTDDIIRTVEDDIRARLTAAAEYHVATVQQEAPRRSGKMASTIHYRLLPDGLGYKVIVPEFYSAFIEFGTKHQPANPFLRRGSEKALPGVMDILDGRKA